MATSDPLPLVFLICSERSGSNFILRLFDSHPEFCGPAPIHLVRHLCDHALRYGDLTDDGNWSALLDDTHDLFASKVAVWKSSLTREELESGVGERSIPAIIRFIYEREALANGKSRLFIKENHTSRYVPFLLSAFPDVRFVFQVRDPRDMALSWKKRRELRGEVYRAANIWKGDQQDGLRLLGQLESAKRIAMVRYEDLVDRPEEELSRLCSFLGVEFSASMLDFHMNSVTQKNAEASQAWENLGKPVMKGNHNKFRDGLSDEEIRYLEWKLADECAFFGYGPVMEPAEDGDALEQKIRSQESMDKEGYRDISETERSARKRHADVLSRMRSRPLLRG